MKRFFSMRKCVQTKLYSQHSLLKPNFDAHMILYLKRLQENIDDLVFLFALYVSVHIRE